MIIRRYLIQEIAHTFFAVILVIMLIAISNKLVRLVAKAAAGDIPADVLFQVMLFQIPELLSFLLPVGFFLAILLSFSRFYSDNEIPAMLACGISWQRLLAVCLGLSVIVMILSFSLTCYFSPKMAQYREQLLRNEGPMFMVQTVTPGRFHSFHHDELVFYVTDLSANRTELKKVFIAEQPKADVGDENWSVLTATMGNLITDQKTGLTYLQLSGGKRYDGVPGESDYTILTFNQYRKLIEAAPVNNNLFFHRTMPTQMLWQNPTSGNLAELQWRLALPLSAPLLALLAVPLSRIPPRTGRFTHLFLAVLICIIYFNLLILSKRAVAGGFLPPFIGVWGVQLALAVGSLLFFMKMSGASLLGIFQKSKSS